MCVKNIFIFIASLRPNALRTYTYSTRGANASFDPTLAGAIAIMAAAKKSRRMIRRADLRNEHFLIVSARLQPSPQPPAHEFDPRFHGEPCRHGTTGQRISASPSRALSAARSRKVYRLRIARACRAARSLRDRGQDVLELRAQPAAARREGAVEGRGADGEGVDPGRGKRTHPFGRIDAAGHDQGARERAARGLDQGQRLDVQGAVGQQVGPGDARQLVRRDAEGGEQLGIEIAARSRAG